jgi:hypothetical protein
MRKKMSNIRSTAALENFKAKHSDVIAEDDLQKIGPPPPSLFEPVKPGLNPLPAELSAYFDTLMNSRDFQLIGELRQWWPIRLLRAAAQERCTEAYRAYLEDLLIRLDVEPSDGILVPQRRAAGAPIKKSTEEIYRTWIGLGKCSPNQLAFHVYGSSYIKANSKERKTLRDRCRQAVERCQKRAR